MNTICFACDQKYFPIFLVAAYSLRQHNHNIDIHLLCVDLDRRMRRFAEGNGINCSEIALDDFTCGTVSSKATYGRLFLDMLLPTYDRCVYMDCDVICTGEIEELLEYSTSAIAGVVFEPIDFCEDHSHLRHVGAIDAYAIPEGQMFNAGVMFMNLQLWRYLHIGAESYALLRRYPQWMTYSDQTALNIVLNGRVDVTGRVRTGQ